MRRSSPRSSAPDRSRSDSVTSNRNADESMSPSRSKRSQRLPATSSRGSDAGESTPTSTRASRSRRSNETNLSESHDRDFTASPSKTQMPSTSWQSSSRSRRSKESSSSLSRGSDFSYSPSRVPQNVTETPSSTRQSTSRSRRNESTASFSREIETPSTSRRTRQQTGSRSTTRSHSLASVEVRSHRTQSASRRMTKEANQKTPRRGKGKRRAEAPPMAEVKNEEPEEGENAAEGHDGEFFVEAILGFMKFEDLKRKAAASKRRKAAQRRSSKGSKSTGGAEKAEEEEDMLPEDHLFDPKDWKKSRSDFAFLVKWHGFPNSDATWQNFELLEDNDVFWEYAREEGFEPDMPLPLEGEGEEQAAGQERGDLMDGEVKKEDETVEEIIEGEKKEKEGGEGEAEKEKKGGEATEESVEGGNEVVAESRQEELWSEWKDDDVIVDSDKEEEEEEEEGIEESMEGLSIDGSEQDTYKPDRDATGEEAAEEHVERDEESMEGIVKTSADDANREETLTKDTKKTDGGEVKSVKDKREEAAMHDVVETPEEGNGESIEIDPLKKETKKTYRGSPGEMKEGEGALTEVAIKSGESIEGSKKIDDKMDGDAEVAMMDGVNLKEKEAPLEDGQGQKRKRDEKEEEEDREGKKSRIELRDEEEIEHGSIVEIGKDTEETEEYIEGESNTEVRGEEEEEIPPQEPAEEEEEDTYDSEEGDNYDYDIEFDDEEAKSARGEMKEDEVSGEKEQARRDGEKKESDEKEGGDEMEEGEKEGALRDLEKEKKDDERQREQQNQDDVEEEEEVEYDTASNDELSKMTEEEWENLEKTLRSCTARVCEAIEKGMINWEICDGSDDKLYEEILRKDVEHLIGGDVGNRGVKRALAKDLTTILFIFRKFEVKRWDFERNLYEDFTEPEMDLMCELNEILGGNADVISRVTADHFRGHANAMMAMVAHQALRVFANIVQGYYFCPECPRWQEPNKDILEAKMKELYNGIDYTARKMLTVVKNSWLKITPTPSGRHLSDQSYVWKAMHLMEFFKAEFTNERPIRDGTVLIDTKLIAPMENCRERQKQTRRLPDRAINLKAACNKQVVSFLRELHKRQNAKPAMDHFHSSVKGKKILAKAIKEEIIRRFPDGQMLAEGRPRQVGPRIYITMADYFTQLKVFEKAEVNQT